MSTVLDPNDALKHELAFPNLLHKLEDRSFC
jgi:hypothetical protein